MDRSVEKKSILKKKNSPIPLNKSRISFDNEMDDQAAIYWVFEDSSTSDKNFQLLYETDLRNSITKFNSIKKFSSFMENNENFDLFHEKKIAIIISSSFALKLAYLLKSNNFIENIFIFYETKNEYLLLSTEFILSDTKSTLRHKTIRTNFILESNFKLIITNILEFYLKSKKTELRSCANLHKRETKNYDQENLVEILNINLINEFSKDLDQICQEYLEINFLIKLMENKEKIEEAKNDFILYCENKINNDDSILKKEDIETFKAKISKRSADNYSVIKMIANNTNYYNFLNDIFINDNFEEIFKIRYLLFIYNSDLNTMKQLRKNNSIYKKEGVDNNIFNSIISNIEKDNNKFFLYKKVHLTKENLKTINSSKTFPLLIKGFMYCIDNMQYLIHNIVTKGQKKQSNVFDYLITTTNNNSRSSTTNPNETVNVIFIFEFEGKVFFDKRYILEFEKEIDNNAFTPLNGKSINNINFEEGIDEKPIEFEKKNYLVSNNLFLIFNKVKNTKYYHEVFCYLKTFNDIRSQFNSSILCLEEKLNRINNKNYESDIFYFIEYAVAIQSKEKLNIALNSVNIKKEEEILKTIDDLLNINNNVKRVGLDSNALLFRKADFKNLIAKYYFSGWFKNFCDKREESLEFYKKALKVAEPIETKKVRLTSVHRDIYLYYSEILMNVYFDLAKININIFINEKNSIYLKLAYENIEKSIEKCNKVFPENSKELADSLNLKGIIYKNYNKFDEAMELYSSSAEIKKKLYASNSLELTSVYNNIGNVLCKKGKFDEALNYYNKSLDITLSFYKEDYAETADCYSNIGNAYYSKGENLLSIENYKKALNLYLNTLGEENTSTSITYINLGLAYYALSDWDNALINYQHCLEIEKIIHGENHSDTANCYNNLGNVYNNRKEYDMAIESLEKCLDIRIKIVGEESTETANTYNNLGNVYLSMGDFDNALKYYKSSLDIKLKKNGEKSSDFACAMNNIGLVHMHKDEFDLALDFFKKSYDIKINSLGKNHPSTNRTKFNIDIVENILEEIKQEEEENELEIDI